MFFRSALRIVEVIFVGSVALPAFAEEFSSKKFQPCKGMSDLNLRERQKATMNTLKIATKCAPYVLQFLGTSFEDCGLTYIDVAPLITKLFCFGQQIIFGILGDERNILYKNVTRETFYQHAIDLIKIINGVYPTMKHHKGQTVLSIPGSLLTDYLATMMNCYTNSTKLPFIKDLRYILFMGESLNKHFIQVMK
ncbi:uncharacterized protein LOC111247601 [Varroa destructor]|uniref:Secreted protein n=1 Tax=Varroa destructor TaxID=109461 RepID=A0A7M7JY58_VARDE|nr:uncharacterized protein LOC111247601 [Varroa destructor]